MKIAAYCRVSTDKDEQLSSINAQKRFFEEYAEKNGFELVKIYADEGISGTKIKNRTQFLQMMCDAETGAFDILAVKDISRFARNTVDFLQSIRRLKALGIETQFLTANMTNMGNSEFVLTMYSAIAQEESANISKRIKFGKKLNAEKGRVPNFVFGYDKIAGDIFNLTINSQEAETVREIFRRYTEVGNGAYKIAQELNSRGILTKRGNLWSQNAVCRILENRIYLGEIINCKEEVSDFLTGERRKLKTEDRIITKRPELQIVEPEIFEKANSLLKSRSARFSENGERHSNAHLFSKIIKCGECGHYFRRIENPQGRVRWVCSSRNIHGTSACRNSFTADEEALIAEINKYFRNTVGDENIPLPKQSSDNVRNAEKLRKKYITLFEEDIISLEELKKRTEYLQKRQEENTSPSCLVDIRRLSCAQFKTIIDYIEVLPDGTASIHIL